MSAQRQISPGPPSATDPDAPFTVDDENDSASEEEARPTHTAEIGTLKKLSVSGGTAWLGSSSGVYFVNTVRRAFASAFTDAGDNSNDATSVPASEDILTGEDADGHSYNGPIHEGPNTTDQDFQRMLASALGKPPTDRKLAMDLVTTFFREWHPLFPFLHGPRFLQDMESIYAPSSTTLIRSSTAPLPPTRGPSDSASSFLPHPDFPHLDPRKLITFQLVINIASISHPDSPICQLPATSRIKSTADVTRMAGSLALNHDIETIQALLAAELYLLATIALRHASTIAGIVLRLIYHAGLHRCPLRYATLTDQECEIRKRIFWSAYALDRHLSLALGDPNTFQDSDIDVCLSAGKELHRAVARELIPPEQRGEEIKMHLPSQMPTQVGQQRQHGERSQSNSRQKNSLTSNKSQREAALTAYVHYGKLTGRIIEIFHKSINFRFPKQDAIGYLSADIENWWNDLPSTLTGEYTASSSGTGISGTEGKERPNSLDDIDSDQTPDVDPAIVQQHKLLTPFFMLLYQQLLLLLNRPRLSLDQSTAEFQQGLQVCIRASRHTLSALKKHNENNQSMFLPGLLSATWMAGLIIAFATQLVLESMNLRWYTVKNIHKVLSLLLKDITSRKAAANGYLPSSAGMSSGPQHVSVPMQKRKRGRDSIAADDGTAIQEPSPKRGSVSGLSPTSSSDFRSADISSPQFGQQAGNFNQQASQQRFANDNSVPTLQQQDPLLFNMPNSTSAVTSSPSLNNANASSNDFSNMPSVPRGAGAALYADPQDMAFAQSSMGLPELSNNGYGVDDQMFWNMDNNLFDVFGAVSWENMTGSVGPMASNANLGWDLFNDYTPTASTSNNAAKSDKTSNAYM